MELSLSGEDSGREAKVVVGDRVVVRLEAAGGAPVQWVVESIRPPLLRQIGEMECEVLSTACGGPVMHRYTFEVTAPGPATLSLGLRSFVEPAHPPYGTFSAQLDCRRR